MQAEPTIRQLRHFLALAAYCHFSRAAEACLVTQSSLSASIKELETTLGLPLFERTKRSVMLTPDGHKAVPMAKAIINALDDLTETVKQSGEPLSGDIRMGVIPTIGPFLLPRVLPGLRARYPRLRLFLQEDKTADLLQSLSDGSLDLVLMATPFKTQNGVTDIVADDPFLVVFPRGHNLSNYETMTPARLKNEEMLVLEGGNCLADQILALAKSVHRPGGFYATSLHTLVQMVDNGLGVTVLPKMAIDAGILRGLKLDFRPFSSPRASRRIALVWRKSSHRDAEYQLLGQQLRDELGTPLPR